MVAEELIIQIRAETARAVRDLQNVQRQTTRTERSFASMAKGLAASVGGFIAVGAAIRGTVRFLGDSAAAASNAEETFAKFETVFRDVSNEASAAVQDLADSFDLANSTAARLVGNTGDLLTGFGLTQEAALDLSIETNQLAIDLASFTNAQGGAEAVSRALTAAYAGERDSLKTYGIVLTEADVQAREFRNAQEGLTFESERQARAFATLQLAQEQSANAIGDYARTSDSAANVQRALSEEVIQLKENLGETVLEGLTPFRQALRELISDFNEVTENARNLSDAASGGELSDIDFVDAIADATRGVAVAQRQYNQAVADNSPIQQTLLQNLREAQSQLRGIEQNYATAVLRAATYAAAQRDATAATQALAEAELAAAAAAAESARINEVAAARRLEIQQTFGQAIIESERTTLEQIEAERREALATAAADYVRTGEEIAQINQFFDQQRQDELDAIADIDRARRAEEAEDEKRLAGFKIQKEAQVLAAAEAAAQQRRQVAASTAQFLLQASSDVLSGLFDNERAAAVVNRISASFNAAINTAEAVTKALTLGPILGPIAAGAVGALGAAQIAAINTQPLPAFQTGGSFVTSGPQPIMVGDGESPRERVTVEPLAGPYAGGGRMMNVTVELDRRPIISTVQRAIESGEIRITTRNIQGGVAA